MACTAEHTEVLLSQRPVLESSLQHILADDILKGEGACDIYCLTLDDYLELSTILDPILPLHTEQLCNLIMSRLTALISEQSTTKDRLQRLLLSVEIPCRAIYTLSKVRGIKPFSTHLPHQVHHLRFLLPAICFAYDNLLANRSWQVRYVLFLWGAVAVRVPFPLITIVEEKAVELAITATRAALTETSRVSDVAANFLARLLARRDAERHRAIVLHITVADALSAKSSADVRVASLALLAAVFKLTHRDDLAPFISSIMSVVTDFHPNSSIEAHRLSKLAHRIALAFLPPRPAAWRYALATTRLLSSGKSMRSSVAGHDGAVIDNESDNTDTLSEENANHLEVIIDLLFELLRHRDSIVRYSAAKGVARLAARLPRPLAHDVTDGLLDLLADRYEARADAAAHGGCLAVAELARRGLLLPVDGQFERALVAIREAARFDLRRSAASVGAHVRDAACYAIWAVARAYGRRDVAPFARLIANAMVPVALLDREVNCRRAASAALQECVGRLSADVFPDGIDLITIADYFSLNDRNFAYLSVTPKVAALGNRVYFSSILEELSKSKLVHWDATVRALAAKSLSELVHLDTDAIITNNIIPELVPMATQRGDVVFRHGALLGLSELVRKIGQDGVRSFAKDIRKIPMVLNDNGFFDGKTGDEMRVASCHLIHSIAQGAPEIYMKDKNGRADAEDSLKLLERVLSCGKEKMYAEATGAYEAMFQHVIRNDSSWHVEATKRVLKGVTESQLAEYQRGFALAIGSCGESTMSNEVVDTLCEIVRTNADVEVRRNAGSSLAKVPLPTLKRKATFVLLALIDGIGDHATDERGDVGSWVREACMISFCNVTERLFLDMNGISVDSSDDLSRAVMSGLCEIVHECCGRIDRTRVIAGKALKGVCRVFIEEQKLFSNVATVCDQLVKIFRFKYTTLSENDEYTESEVEFSNGKYSFPAMRKALQVLEVRGAVMRGFVSAGGGTRSQFKAPCEALVDYFQDLKDNRTKGSEFENYIVKAVKLKNEYLMVPALNVIAALARQGALHGIENEVLVRTVRDVRASWRGRMRDVRLVLAGMAVLDELVCLSIGADGQFMFTMGSIGRECLEALVVILGGAIPRLRKVAAESVFIALTMCDIDGYGTGCSKGVTSAMDVLLDSPWNGISVSEARAQRDDICKHLGIKAPVVVRTGA